jgi:hypothetical protein
MAYNLRPTPHLFMLIPPPDLPPADVSEFIRVEWLGLQQDQLHAQIGDGTQNNFLEI